GVLLDHLEVETAPGITVWQAEVLDSEEPIVVQNCVCRGRESTDILVEGLLDYQTPSPCRRVCVRNNTLADPSDGIVLLGSVQQAQVVGNRVRGATQAGIKLEALLEGTKDVLIANNTLAECAEALRYWDDGMKQDRGENIQVRNNLVLGSRQADL